MLALWCEAECVLHHTGWGAGRGRGVPMIDHRPVPLMQHHPHHVAG